MIPTELMFAFPFRIWEDDQMERKEQFDSIGGDSYSPDNKWVRGWKKIFYDNIIDISDTYYLEQDIDDVIKNGFSCSIITTFDAKYTCDWKLATLERKLNEHHTKMMEHKQLIKKKKSMLSPLNNKNPLKIQDNSDNIALS